MLAGGDEVSMRCMDACASGRGLSGVIESPVECLNTCEAEAYSEKEVTQYRSAAPRVISGLCSSAGLCSVPAVIFSVGVSSIVNRGK